MHNSTTRGDFAKIYFACHQYNSVMKLRNKKRQKLTCWPQCVQLIPMKILLYAQAQQHTAQNKSNQSMFNSEGLKTIKSAHL